MLSTEDLRNAMTSIPILVGDEVSLGYWNESQTIGVGVDAEAAVVFLLRACTKSQVVMGRKFDFDPDTSIRIKGIGSATNISLLRLAPDVVTAENIDAFVAVFSGLIELSNDLDVALGNVIEELRPLFENGVFSPIPIETIVGLVGELLVILAAEDPAALIRAWHSDPNGQFDFAISRERLEVKSTRGGSRVHTFSSGQIPGPPGTFTTIASVKIYSVEVGESLVDLVRMISARLENRDQKTMLLAKTIAVIRRPIDAIESIVFDIDASMQSIELFDSSEIPAPEVVFGVLSMKWEAMLPDLSKVEKAGSLVQSFESR
jgi:hypothetical protein